MAFISNIKGGLVGFRAKISVRRRKIKIKVRDYLRKMVFPVRRLWIAFTARAKARKTGTGLLKLHDEIQTCSYDDVQKMWEMLKTSDSDKSPPKKHKHGSFWRVFVWSRHGPPPAK